MKTKFSMEQPYMLPILYCQNHGCWCPGDLSRQGISRHGMDQIIQNIPSLALEELMSSAAYKHEHTEEIVIHANYISMG